MLATLNSDAEMLARKLLVKQANSIHARIGSDDAWSTDDDDTFTEFYSAAELAVEHAHEEEAATRAWPPSCWCIATNESEYLQR